MTLGGNTDGSRLVGKATDLQSKRVARIKLKVPCTCWRRLPNAGDIIIQAKKIDSMSANLHDRR